MRIRLSCPITLSEFARHAGVILNGQERDGLRSVLYLTTDSREVEAGDLFIALSSASGFKVTYLQDALDRGASAILMDSSLPSIANVATLLASDPLEALATIAKWLLEKISPRVIAITGSVGKTTTRHLLATILRTCYRVHESPHSYNNLLGCCLTILTMPFDTEYLVAECGMDGPGQISRLSRLLAPNAAIITNIGLSHIEKLGSVEAIRNAKLEILDGMHGGSIFYPGEASMLSPFVPHNAVPVYQSPQKDHPYVTNVCVDGSGTTFDYVSPFRYQKEMRIPAFGTHIAHCAKLALALAESEGVDSQSMYRGCANYESVDNRLKVYSFKDITVIDDSFNASPDAMLSALSSFSCIASHKKAILRIAVLGDMLELGKYRVASHQKIGEKASEVSTHLCAIGNNAYEYGSGAKRAGMSKEQIWILPEKTNTEDLIKRLYQLVEHTPSAILFKGSHATPLASLAKAFITKVASMPERII